jgi:L-threonylcarbamoyladenylate synthase
METIIGTSVEDAVGWLKRGEPVALPTETVYGLAAPLFAEEVIRKIYTIKKRPSSNPLIVHVVNFQQLQEIAETTSLVRVLTERFWPGPLTIVLKKKQFVPDIVTAGQSSIAVRCPMVSLFRQVIDAIGEPLAAPSANSFQRTSPTTAVHVMNDLGGKIPYILDGGACACGLESTILSLLNEERPELLRYGPVTTEVLEEFLCRTLVMPSTPDPGIGPLLSPGLYKKHYSPRTPLYLVDKLSDYVPPCSYRQIFKERAAHVFLVSPSRPLNDNERVLSRNNDLNEAAARLFACLQMLDCQGWKSIWIESAANEGIGRAVNDRLSRAAHVDLRTTNSI